MLYYFLNSVLFIFFSELLTNTSGSETSQNNVFMNNPRSSYNIALSSQQSGTSSVSGSGIERQLSPDCTISNQSHLIANLPSLNTHRNNNQSNFGHKSS